MADADSSAGAGDSPELDHNASTRPLTGLILGSVPHKLLHRSSVPVLVVPVPDGA